MAKKNRKKAAPGKGRGSWDSAGWGFWGIATGVLLIPALYVSYRMVRDDVPSVAPIAIGVLLAVVCGSIVSYVVNALLQWRSRRRRLAERKQALKK